MNPSNSTTTRQELFLQRIMGDFRLFLRAVWDDRKLDKVAPLSDVELDIAHYAATGPKTRGILAPRGLGKTHLVGAALPLFRLLRDPDRKIIVPSKSHTHAKKVIGFQREWINACWFLEELTPRRDQTDAADRFQVGPARESVQPSVTAIGIDGQLEGNRAHTIIPDDVETDKNTQTLDARESLDERVKEFKDILYPDRAPADGGPIDPCEICYVGTYHHEESLYLKLPKRDYAFQTWPIAIPDPADKLLNLAPMVQRMIDAGASPGTPVFGHRFGTENIAEKKSEGFTRFGMQHMLISDLAATNRYPIRLSDLIVLNTDPRTAPCSVSWGYRDHNGSTALEDIPSLGFGQDRLHRPAMIDKLWAPYTGTRAHLDPAGRGEDESALAIAAHLAGFFWIKRVQGWMDGSSNATIDAQCLVLREQGATTLSIEDNADTLNVFLPLFESRLRRWFLEPGEHPSFPDGWKCGIERVHNTGQKEVRIIEAIEPYATSHRLVFDPLCLIPTPGQDIDYSLQHQLTRITKQRKALRHDDKADAVASVLRAWSHALRQDPEKARDRHDTDALAKAQAFLEKLGDHPRRRPCFFSHR